MEIPLPVPAYDLVSTLKPGDKVKAYCEILGCTVEGVISRAIGVNEWEMQVGKDHYSVNPGNIVAVIRNKENYRRVSDKPPKEPKAKKPGAT